mmetsp:Transcript_22266/g.66902  ORF Transcript_22266/g.66902 Transcript_22266/m.66902 type:complete len:225 (+) Transcript_22266:992-1666(+)
MQTATEAHHQLGELLGKEDSKLEVPDAIRWIRTKVAEAESASSLATLPKITALVAAAHSSAAAEDPDKKKEWTPRAPPGVGDVACAGCGRHPHFGKGGVLQLCRLTSHVSGRTITDSDRSAYHAGHKHIRVTERNGTGVPVEHNGRNFVLVTQTTSQALDLDAERAHIRQLFASPAHTPLPAAAAAPPEAETHAIVDRIMSHLRRDPVLRSSFSQGRNSKEDMM